MPTTPTQTSTAAAPSAAVQALNASREAAYNAKQNVYSGNNANLATFSAANPTLNTAGGSGTAPAQVPTRAPAVFSSTSATNSLNGTIIPIMQSAGAAVAAHAANVSSQNDPNYNFRQGETADQYNARIKAYRASSTNNTTTTTPTTTTPSATDAAATQIANTPETGHQFFYDASGNTVELPVGSAPPPGYSSNKPAPNPVTSNTPIQSSFVTSGGSTFAQYNNGTYGQIDKNGNYVGAISPDQYQQQQANSPQAQADDLHAKVASIMSSLDMVAKGAYPLNANQQAIINGLQTQLNADVAQQTQANNNYTGGVTVAENLYGMGTSLAGIGAIKASVDQGVTKILDLQTKAATASAQMLDGFQKDNMAMLKTAYDVYSDSTKQIQDNINKIQDGIRQAKVDAQTEQHQKFSDFMTSQNYNLSTKKQAFDQYIQQANLDETKKKDAQDAWYKAQDIALRKQAQTPFAPGGTTPVGLTPTGKPNGQQQSAFLAQYPSTVQAQIKGLANYTQLPTDFPARANKGQMDRATAVALAKQYDPTYDENAAASRAALQKSLTSGAYSQTINGANTLIQHLDAMRQYGKGLNNSPLPFLNAPMNSLTTALGGANPTQFNIARDAVASEAAKIYKGVGAPSEKEIADWKSSVNANSSDAQREAAIKAITDLMAGKLSTLSDQYKGVMGNTGSFQILTDRNAKTLQSMGIEPTTVDPTYGNSPANQVSRFYTSSPQNASYIDSIMKAAPQATPDEVIDTLHQYGIDTE
jgi:hypothetical protein